MKKKLIPMLAVLIAGFVPIAPAFAEANGMPPCCAPPISVAITVPDADAPEKGIIKADGTPITRQQFDELNALFDSCSQQVEFNLDYQAAHPLPGRPPLSAEQRKTVFTVARNSCFHDFLEVYEKQNPDMAGARVKGK